MLFKKVLLWPFYLYFYLWLYLGKRLEKIIKNSWKVFVFNRSASERFVEVFTGLLQGCFIFMGIEAGIFGGFSYGGMIGTLIFPGIGTMVGAGLGLLLGMIVGGGIAAYIGKQISRFAKFCAVKSGVIYASEDALVSKTNPEKYGYSASCIANNDLRSKFIAMCKEMRAEKSKISSIWSKKQKDYFSQMVDEVLSKPNEYTHHCYRDIGNLRFTFYPPPPPLSVAPNNSIRYFQFTIRN